MSYYYQISFQTVKPEDLFKFFVKLKDESLHSYKSIAKECFYTIPIDDSKKYQDLSNIEKNHLEKWTLEKFSMRTFYIPEYQLLGMIGVPNCLKHNFSQTIIFDDCIKHNYPKDIYTGISLFETIYKKWHICSEKELKEQCCRLHPYTASQMLKDNSINDVRKIMAYNEIWGFVEPECSNRLINIGLIDGYCNIIRKFSRICCDYKKI